MPLIRSEQIELSGTFKFGMAAADPGMTPDGGLVPNVALVMEDTDPAGRSVTVIALFSENGLRKLIAEAQHQLDQGRAALVVPGRR